MVRTAMKYIYTGDSTAVKAFETHEGNDELSQLVNLGKLFEIYTSYKMFDLSSYGKPNNWLARSVRESNVGRIPVFWLYTDPLQKQFWIDEQRFFPNIPEENKNKPFQSHHTNKYRYPHTHKHLSNKGQGPEMGSGPRNVTCKRRDVISRFVVFWHTEVWPYS